MPQRPSRPVAHTPPKGGTEWHDLDDHLREVARLAADFATPFGGQDLAWWAGIYHDLGKAHPDFQDYLWKCFLEPDRKHPTVDHKTAGALQVRVDTQFEAMMQVLHGHHGGLSDTGDLNLRIESVIAHDQPRILAALAAFSSLAVNEDIRARRKPADIPAWARAQPRSLEFFARMIFAALVDADALDTERHWNRDSSDVRDLEKPTNIDLLKAFEQDQSAFIASPAVAANRDSPVNQVRAEVYEACVRMATTSPGFFRLTVPTGGGKTRSGLAFALHHARAHGMRRVIAAVPFLTITDQTARVYREILNDDRAMLEHHSAVETPEPDQDGSEAPDAIWQRLASQNWDAPLIVTTTVQLFESLFSNRTSQCRKLHNIAGSVIILDEIQTVPVDLRGPIFDALRELVDHYNVSVVLSTATQPALDTIAAELTASGREIIEIAPEPARLFRSLERVRYEWPSLGEVWSWERVAEEVHGELQVMVIVNTIKDAATLFDALEDEEAFHLSTRMCGAHRRDVLDEVRARLKLGLPCRLVSTQLVEAGVDLDFPLVMRAIGPLDRVVQAAGRCNREGRLPGMGRMIVFSAETDHRMPSGSYSRGAQETRNLLRRGTLDLLDPDTFIHYFSLLYSGELPDARGIQPLRDERRYETVNDLFRMIDDHTIPVFVHYHRDEPEIDRSKSHTILDALRRRDGRDRSSVRQRFRDAQPYIVNCSGWLKDTYEERGTIVEVVPGLWEWKDTYDAKRGIVDRRLEPDGLFV